MVFFSNYQCVPWARMWPPVSGRARFFLVPLLGRPSMTPRIEALKEPAMWGAAVGQILYSLGPCLGTTITMASYNHSQANIFRANLVVSVSNSLFSVVSGFLVFSVLGYIAETQGKTIEELAKSSGPGLVFIVLAEAVAMMPGPQFFSILLYLMLFILGLDSAFAWIEAINSHISDVLLVNGRVPNRPLIAAATCAMFFLASIVLCTRAGSYWIDLIDHFAGTYLLLWIGILELMLVIFVYGVDRIARDVLEMTGRPVPRSWTVCWCISPVVLAGLLCTTLYEDLRKVYGGYPPEAVYCTMTVIILIGMLPFVVAVWRMLHKPKEVSLTVAQWS
eukprot:NODE_1309_length_1196_cov_83.699215_g1077_i0.p1 GENE.NODE_1309_length_1196_cov_83.699215_g1077_i0~~NODE_1309_length_1196_cov_83.699215_g1077_i0.p1  ORF type:complete len:334 (+),score=63.45 NODE_1309_length_1196_cov_83.699215_g1077_i0:119-1120(+)